MRALPSRFSQPDKPVTVKKKRAYLEHLPPPVAGIADDAKTGESNQKFASVLTNFTVEDDRIRVRAGYRRIATISGNPPVQRLVPYYGSSDNLAAAAGGSLWQALTGALLKSGFVSNDWHWTGFANLGDAQYTVMVNGSDGVWSWDGNALQNGASVSVTKIGKNATAPNNAIVTAASIAGLSEFDSVIITGADAGHSAANGNHRITNLNAGAKTFELVGVNSLPWSADQTTGTMNYVQQGSVAKEDVRAPAGAAWISPANLQIVVAHMNRLFFADSTNLCFYYLPLMQKDGELDVFPLSAIFRKGGTIRAMASWTTDAGIGMDDVLAVFTSKGQVALYRGVDPDTDFTLVGVYTFDPPHNRYCVLNYGGELYALIPSGLTPMSTVLKSGREGTEAADKTVVSRFITASALNIDRPGWELFLNPNSGRVFCNVPEGGSVYRQMVRNMAKPAWQEWKYLPARCFSWIHPYVYFADDKGNVYEMHPSHQSDDGLPIQVDVQTAWSQYKTPAIKHFKMILPYIITDGNPQPVIDVGVDYDSAGPYNTPDITGANPSDATWNVASWDLPDGFGPIPAYPPNPAFPNGVPPVSGDYWVGGSKNWINWTGVGAIGRVGCVRMQAAVLNCSFSVSGFDILYERGSVFG
jgi:hypothetical protein